MDQKCADFTHGNCDGSEWNRKFDLFSSYVYIDRSTYVLLHACADGNN